jgi:hypothetical protein
MKQVPQIMQQGGSDKRVGFASQLGEVCGLQGMLEVRYRLATVLLMAALAV